MAKDQKDLHLTIHSQYIKDLSFENPGAPAVFATMTKFPPELSVNFDINVAHLRERSFEVVLNLRVEAKVREKTGFLIEMDYAGIVSLGDAITKEKEQKTLWGEVPRYLFPFARSVMATVTREGGFPPLVINPIDFEAVYEARSAKTAAKEEATS